jgi:hypothetical protein
MKRIILTVIFIFLSTWSIGQIEIFGQDFKYSPGEHFEAIYCDGEILTIGISRDIQKNQSEIRITNYSLSGQKTNDLKISLDKMYVLSICEFDTLIRTAYLLVEYYGVSHDTFTTSEVIAISFEGTIKWRHKIGYIAGGMCSIDNQLYVVSASDMYSQTYLFLLEINTGAVVWEKTFSGLAPPLYSRTRISKTGNNQFDFFYSPISWKQWSHLINEDSIMAPYIKVQFDSLGNINDLDTIVFKRNFCFYQLFENSYFFLAKSNKEEEPMFTAYSYLLHDSTLNHLFDQKIPEGVMVNNEILVDSESVIINYVTGSRFYSTLYCRKSGELSSQFIENSDLLIRVIHPIESLKNWYILVGRNVSTNKPVIVFSRVHEAS